MPSISVGTSAVALPANYVGVQTLLKAAEGNAGTIAVGIDDPSLTVTGDTTHDGYPLGAGDGVVIPKFKATNTSQIYVRASQASQTLYFYPDIIPAGESGASGGSVTVGSALPAGENHVGQVGGELSNPSANFTRPNDTTAYASGDLVANSTTAGSVTPLSWTAARVAAGSFLVRRVRLKKSGTGITNASFRLHLYAASPTVANGDNGAWSSTHSSYLGSFDVAVDKAFSDAAGGNGVPLVGSELGIKLASGQTIYGLLEARAAYTPAAQEVFTVELEALQN